MSYNTQRFSIAKDLKEWVEWINISPWGILEWSDERNWKYHYEWSSDLLSYMNIYIDQLESFGKYYPEMDLFLQNIHWDPIFLSAKKIIEQISKKIEAENNLIIIHSSPLEMVIIWEFFKNNGVKNIAYNFNRVPAVNSISKSLEAGLFLVSWTHISWLKEKINTLWVSLKTKTDISKFKDSIILLDENDIPQNWNISRIDPYIKSAIGWKENIVTYRVDEMPKSELLLKQNIKDIYFFDTDSSNAIDAYYQSTLGKLFHFHSYIIDSIVPENIWYYEDYVVEKNQEYLVYKNEILSKNEILKESLKEGWGMEKWKGKSNIFARPEISRSQISLKEWMIYLGWLAVILPLFLLMEVRWWQGVFTKSSTGWWNYTPSSSSSFRSSSSSWWSSFTHTPSASTSSSISSFGGGWFSKWGG